MKEGAHVFVTGRRQEFGTITEDNFDKTFDLNARATLFNTLSPGPIDTPIFGKVGLNEEQVEGFKASVTQQVPLGRFGDSIEIAKPALFLASDDSSFVTGVELTVDGGMAQV